MELHLGDSIEAMNRAEDSIGGIPDLVLLDPMFPERQKSALVKKKFQLIHRLESPCMEEETLLNAAIAAGPRKILIKRPLKGPWLAGRKPGYSISGKAVRYDCILYLEISPNRKINNCYLENYSNRLVYLYKKCIILLMIYSKWNKEDYGNE